MRYYEPPVMATRLGAWNLPNVTKSFIKNFWRPKKPMYVHHVWSGLGDQLVCQIMTGDHKLRSFSAIRGPKFDQCGQKEKMSCLPTSWVFCDAIKFEWKLYEILLREVWQTDRQTESRHWNVYCYPLNSDTSYLFLSVFDLEVLYDFTERP